LKIPFAYFYLCCIINYKKNLKKHKQARPVVWALIKHIDVFPVSRFTNVSFIREHILVMIEEYIYILVRH
jgi:hypothetical protein